MGAAGIQGATGIKVGQDQSGMGVRHGLASLLDRLLPLRADMKETENEDY